MPVTKGGLAKVLIILERMRYPLNVLPNPCGL